MFKSKKNIMDNKKQKRNDAVDPYSFQIGGSHYSSMKIQPSEFINKNNLPFAEGNAIKYLCRHKQKGQKQDLEKAIHYCQMAIDRDYPDESKKDKKNKSNSWGILNES